MRWLAPRGKGGEGLGVLAQSEHFFDAYTTVTELLVLKRGRRQQARYTRGFQTERVLERQSTPRCISKTAATWCSATPRSLSISLSHAEKGPQPRCARSASRHITLSCISNREVCFCAVPSASYRSYGSGGPGQGHDASDGRGGGHPFGNRLGDGDALLATAKQHEEQPHQGAKDSVENTISTARRKSDNDKTYEGEGGEMAF